MHDVINPDISRQADELREQFMQARPFRHALFQNFLTLDFLRQITEQFPQPAEKDMVSEFGDRSLKHTVEAIRELGDPFKRWDTVLRSPEFIEFLQTVTGIPKLIFDPEYIGAGTHNNLHGQSLDVHVDFNRHPKNGQHRRLNLIVYLCEEWDPTWGGCIELHRDAWDRSTHREFVSYPPFANHAVLFETGEHTWHGFKTINLPKAKRHLSRKSLTVYYYTDALENDKPAPEHSTIYVPDWIPDSVRPGEILSEEAFRELETVMYRRDHFLQRLYERENKLHHQLAALHKLHRKLKRLMPWRYR